MAQFIIWLNENPVWLVALAAFFGNLGKILELLERYGPAWAKLHRAELNGKERAEVVSILQHFLDEEQEARTKERERFDKRLEVLEDERTKMLKQVTEIIVMSARQREAIIGTLSTVAGTLRALTRRINTAIHQCEQAQEENL